MTAAAATTANPITADAVALAAAVRSQLGPALLLAAFLAIWAIATVVYGFNGFIVGADAAVLGMFGILLALTRQ